MSPIFTMMESIRRSEMHRKKARQSAQKGLSLIEVLIGVALSSILMLALLTLYIAGQKYFFNQGAKADMMQDSSYPSEWISRDIRGAIQAVGTYAGSSETYTTSATTLVLEVFSIDAAESVILGSSDYIIYRQNPTDSNLLERIVEADGVSSRFNGTRILADDINSIVFRFYNTTGVEITSSYEDSFNIHYEFTSTQRSIGRAGQPYNETFRSWAKIRSKAFE